MLYHKLGRLILKRINTAEQNFSSVFIIESVNNIQMKLLKKARINPPR
jgi:hypothetical protein